MAAHYDKSDLQEWTQKRALPLLIYVTFQDAGSPHEPQFRCSVRVNGSFYQADGLFRRKKEAERAAAGVALHSLIVAEEQGRLLHQEVPMKGMEGNFVVENINSQMPPPALSLLAALHELKKLPLFRPGLHVQQGLKFWAMDLLAIQDKRDLFGSVAPTELMEWLRKEHVDAMSTGKSLSPFPNDTE